jgi:ligand-binding SRPBCC domain-containing protein
MHLIERTQWVSVPLEETFRFHADPRNLGRITPPWLAFTLERAELQGVATREGRNASEAGDDIEMAEGLRLHYRIRPLLVPQRWTSEITVWDPPHRFVDEQVRGPYRRWHHEHRFRSVPGGTEITDRVEYELPLGPLGKLAHLLLVRRQLGSIFDYRERTITKLLGGEDGR